VIYLDSSALVKLVRPESGSAALKEELATVAEPVLVSSVLADVEVSRAVRRSAPHLLHRVPDVIESLQLVEMGPAVRALARSYDAPALRAADAIHLASADLLRRETGQAIDAFVCYDRALSAAAAGADLPVRSPG
jgi:uncharacterized protein